ncbi:unnamed protein product [Caenorhabditis sp. 36 PRJEB53466]|nr:unnamed protein product [Caenorhabditis sp. 36 PRJEB53466]
MISDNETKRLKQLIKVDVNRNVPLDKISVWTRHIADEVFRSIPDDDGDIDIVVTVKFSGSSYRGMQKSVKKIIMDTLEEELLR